MRNITTYLQLAGITGEPAAAAAIALQAALTDAQNEIGNAQADTQREIRDNQQARALAAAFRKTAEAAGVDLEPLSDPSISAERRRELSDGAATAVLQYVQGAGTDNAAVTSVLREAGFDVEAYGKAGKDKRAEMAREFVEGINSTREKLVRAERTATYTALGLDPKKAEKLLGSLKLEEGEVTVDGNTVKTFGVRADDGTFQSVEQVLAADGWSLSDLAPKTANTQAEAKSDASSQLGFLDGSGQAATNQSTPDALSFLDAAPKAQS